jgi:hypothetical protein
MRYTDRIAIRTSKELRSKLAAKAILQGHGNLSITARILLEKAMKCKPAQRSTN